MKKMLFVGLFFFVCQAAFSQAIAFDELVKLLKMSEYDQSQYLSGKGWNLGDGHGDTIVYAHTGDDTVVTNAYVYVVSVEQQYAGAIVTVGLHFTTRSLYDQYMHKIHAMQLHTVKSETKGNMSSTEYGNKDYTAHVKKIRTDAKHYDYFVDVMKK